MKVHGTSKDPCTLTKPDTGRPRTGAVAGAGGTGPRIVRTTPITPPGSAGKTTAKKTTESLTKAETSAIVKALNSGDVAAVRTFLDKGIDRDVSIYGMPLLQKAANISSAEMVKPIVARGGDLTYKDRSGNSALAQAQSNTKHCQEVIAVLLEARIEVKRETPVWKIAFKIQNEKFKPGGKEALEMLSAKKRGERQHTHQQDRQHSVDVRRQDGLAGTGRILSNPRR